MTLAADTFEAYRKTTKRSVFLDEMNKVVPWSSRCALIDFPNRSKRTPRYFDSTQPPGHLGRVAPDVLQ